MPSSFRTPTFPSSLACTGICLEILSGGITLNFQMFPHFPYGLQFAEDFSDLKLHFIFIGETLSRKFNPLRLKVANEVNNLCVHRAPCGERWDHRTAYTPNNGIKYVPRKIPVWFSLRHFGGDDHKRTETKEFRICRFICTAMALTALENDQRNFCLALVNQCGEFGGNAQWKTWIVRFWFPFPNFPEAILTRCGPLNKLRTARPRSIQNCHEHLLQ